MQINLYPYQYIYIYIYIFNNIQKIRHAMEEASVRSKSSTPPINSTSNVLVFGSKGYVLKQYNVSYLLFLLNIQTSLPPAKIFTAIMPRPKTLEEAIQQVDKYDLLVYAERASTLGLHRTNANDYKLKMSRIGLKKTYDTLYQQENLRPVLDRILGQSLSQGSQALKRLRKSVSLQLFTLLFRSCFVLGVFRQCDFFFQIINFKPILKQFKIEVFGRACHIFLQLFALILHFAIKTSFLQLIMQIYVEDCRK